MFTYLIQSSACLIALYSIYHFVLAELTFFRHNRAYLLAAIILSLIVPALAPYIELPQESLPVVHWSYIAAEMQQIYVTPDEGLDYEALMWMALGAVYFIGVLTVMVRMFLGLYRIRTYHSTGVKDVKSGYTLITTDAVHLPFSFFNSVYISRHVPLSDHVQTILDHEKIHIRHWHTVDVLFAEIVQAFYWFNPVMIFYKRALRQAHEYLADDIICRDKSVSSYTDLLLSKSQSGMEMALANQFFSSQIKKRIHMMTKNKTDRHAAWKYALVMPLLLGLVVVFSSPEIKGDIQKVIADIITDTIPATQRADLDDVQTLSVKNETIKITLKNGEVESYDLSDSKESEIFQEKYGELAPPPPPPPPMLHGNALIPEGVESIKVEEDRIIVKHTNGISKFFYLSDQGDMKTYKNFYGEIPKPPAPPSVNEQIPPPPPPPIPSNVKAITQFLGQKSKPLFVLDGNKLESDQKLNIHPGDIENVSVLKGESSTNLYGEEGKNGVVLVTTKSAIKEIFRVVEQMPRFPGCEDINNDKEKEDCARTKLLEYIYKNLKYPAEARKKNIEGQVVVQFVIKPDGLIKDVKVVREIGEGCGSEVKILVEGMNKMAVRWIPGKQHGKYVNVLYTLPVKFALQGNDGKSINNNEISHMRPISSGEIFKVVDQMPRFPGCEDQPVGHERDDCAKTKMLEYIYQNLKYPQEARKNQVEGQVVLQFVVGQDGILREIRIARDIGSGCGKAAADVIESMNDKKLKWTPGVQKGRNVDVLYTLPVKFKLEGAKSISTLENKPIVNYYSGTVNWKECSELGAFFKSMMCSFGKTNDFVKLHLNYPSEAKINSIEGSCKIRAYYDEKGRQNKAEIIEDIGYGCGEEALRVVKLMPEMSPALKDGKPTNGVLMIYVTFKLTKDEEKKLAATNLIVTAYGKEEKKVNSKLPTVIKSTKYPSAISEVDQLPWLDACAHLPDIIEVKKCAENKFLSTLYSNINYPKKAREKGISGIVYAQFVVNKKGNMDDITILSDIGYGTDETVRNALEKLKNSDSWIPGRKNGKEVDVVYQLSVKFEIEGDFKKVVRLSSLDNRLTNVKIFPNPSQDQVHISFEGEPMDVDVKLSDISGKTLVAQNFKNDQFLFKGTIDISHLNIKGNITVTIKQNNKLVREQIVVIR